MRTAIITYHRVYNYGAALQAYATACYFNRQGLDAQIIDYVPDRILNYGSFKQVYSENRLFFANPIKCFAATLVKMPSYKMQIKVFDRFLDENVPMTKRYNGSAKLHENAPKAELYCTGSDQVWNNLYDPAFDKSFFLDFAPEGTLFAFSASFGKSAFSKTEMEKITPWLRRYRAISVREESGLEILKDVEVPLKENTLDPTLMLSEQEWRKLIAPIEQENYILVYQLHGTSKAEQYAEQVAKETGLPVIRITTMLHQKAGNAKKVLLPTVEQFVSYFYNASYVFTDSFHGTAFSLNFGKNVVVTLPEGTGGRILSILKLLGEENRIAGSAKQAVEIIKTPLNKERVQIKLNEERKKADDYLKAAVLQCEKKVR